MDADDRRAYLHLLSAYGTKHGPEVWAYCLMSNHVHLVVTPETERSHLSYRPSPVLLSPES